MYKTILIPIDLAHKEKAMNMVKIAKCLGGGEGKMVFVNVVEEIPAYVAAQLPEGTMDATKKQALKELQELAEELGVSPKIAVRIGHAPSAILTEAEEEGAEVIVIASHRPGLQDYLLGSTAARVVRHATIPVFVER